MKFRYLILSAMAVLAISCGKEEYTLSGTGEKTPLEISVSLDDSYAGTKAANGAFEVSDKLYAYVQQVARSGAQAPYTYTSKIAELVEFTVGQAGSTVVTDKLGTVLYWDDFSSDDDDIRNDGRYLRVGYGFCFNGNTGFTNSSINISGTIQNWSVNTDQKTIGTKTSDLLWAGPQEEKKYDHDHVRPDAQDKVTLPVTYTHAMSKVTVELNLDEGYSAFGAADTYPVLYANQTASIVNASNQTITTTVNSTGITMKLLSSADKKRVYEAIIAPTVMKAGQKLLDVTVEGNTYHINLSDAILTSVYPAGSGNATWSSNLSAYTEPSTGTVAATSGSYDSTNGGITLPGVNYKMVVTLKKQRIEVQAKITDWTEVVSSAEGEIKFSADVVGTGLTEDGEIAKSGSAFDLWMGASNTDTSYGTYKTTFTHDGSKWDPATKIYWPNGNDSYYYRALSLLEDGAYKSVTGSKTAEQGKDLLWAQTSAHSGTDVEGASFSYSAGEAIRPRTGNVPLTFEHAMSKISVKVQNAAGAPDDQKVVIDGAKISIINLYDKGEIAVSSGDMVTDKMDVSDAAAGNDYFTFKDGSVTLKNSEYVWEDNLVIPQSLIKDKDGVARNTAPVFYSSSNMAFIYNASGTSVGTGAGAYYLKTDLELVPAVRYTEAEADGFNAALPGAIRTSDVKTPGVKYTQDEIDAANAIVHADGYQTGANPEAEAVALKTTDDWKIAPVYYSEAEVKAHNSALVGAVKEGDIKEDAYYKLPDGQTLTPHEIGGLLSKGSKIMMYITLADGTRYNLDLANCKVNGSSSLITEWEKGKHYVYTISLGKEEVTFMALVKDWVEVKGNGNANLDWD